MFTDRVYRVPSTEGLTEYREEKPGVFTPPPAIPPGYTFSLPPADGTTTIINQPIVVTLAISGINCYGCVGAIQEGLNSVIKQQSSDDSSAGGGVAALREWRITAATVTRVPFDLLAIVLEPRADVTAPDAALAVTVAVDVAMRVAALKCGKALALCTHHPALPVDAANDSHLWLIEAHEAALGATKSGTMASDGCVVPGAVTWGRRRFDTAREFIESGCKSLVVAPAPAAVVEASQAATVALGTIPERSAPSSTDASDATSGGPFAPSPQTAFATPTQTGSTARDAVPPCAAPNVAVAKGASDILTVEFAVDGMSCSSCSNKIEKALRQMPEVVEANVNFAAACAQVRVVMPPRPLPTARTAIANALAAGITALGFHATVVKVSGGGGPPPTRSPGVTGTAVVAIDSPFTLEYAIEGMSCSSCSAKIEKALRAVPGVIEANVNFAAACAVVRVLDQASAPPADQARHLAQMMTQLGFQPTLTTSLASLSRHSRGRPSPAGGAPTFRLSPAAGYSINVDGGGTGTSAGGSSGRYDATDGAHHFDDLGDGAVDGAEAFEDTHDDSATRRALERTAEVAELTRTSVVAVLCAVPILALMALDMLPTGSVQAWLRAPLHGRLGWAFSGRSILEATLSTPAVFYSGRPFVVRAVRGLRHRSMNMDTLVAVGVLASYVSSVACAILMLCGGSHSLHLNFDTAAVLLAFMCVGKLLEAKAKRHTGDALLTLMQLTPAQALLVHNVQRPETDEQVDTRRVSVGQILRVLPGCRVPTDGVVVEGATDVDEAMVTGEPLPVAKAPGANMIGGTQCLTGAVCMRVTRVGRETTVSQIVDVVRRAQMSKPDVLRVADKIGSYFVPFVLIAASIVFVVWASMGAAQAYPGSWRTDGESSLVFAFNFFLATVVVACPCALGLAAPTAIMVGTGIAARRGILFKSGDALERARKVTCVLFDKTGTLTTGAMTVARFIPAPAMDTASSIAQHRRFAGVMEGIAAIEARSVHPIARAVVQFARERVAVAVRTSGRAGDATDATCCGGAQLAIDAPTSEVVEWAQEIGKGVRGVVRVTTTGAGATGTLSPTDATEYTMLIGSIRYLTAASIAVPPEEVASLEVAQRNERAVAICAAVNGRYFGAFLLVDPPKADARATIRYLVTQWQIQPHMITGDAAATAIAVARRLGIPQGNVEAQMLPEGKVDAVRRLQDEGHVVMFVGDGVNDAAALTQADVGVAIGAGTDVAVDAADAVLMQPQLYDLVALLFLSKTTIRRINLNFIWAAVYNALMLPLATGMLYPLILRQLPPMAAGGAMVFSSLSVVLSSLALRLVTLPHWDGAANALTDAPSSSSASSSRRSALCEESAKRGGGRGGAAMGGDNGGAPRIAAAAAGSPAARSPIPAGETDENYHHQLSPPASEVTFLLADSSS